MGTYVEVVNPAAFKNARLADAAVLFNHDATRVLGRVAAGTATITIDPDALRYRAEIDPENGGNMDVFRSIRRGDVFQSSWGFVISKDRWSVDSTGRTTREILEVVEIFDVSPVTFPANPFTTATAI
jgi:HK97 family phage prohead protease